MSSWLTAWWSDALNKRMCQFLIHRYLGHLLKEKLSLEQLSVDLYNGTGLIQGVNVDTSYVNECLELANVPVRLADGYIGEIKVMVPWAKLLEDSCWIEVKQLEITIHPKPPASTRTAPDLMASMLESMVGSLSSSVDLARSFLSEQDQLLSQDATSLASSSDEGVEAFAQIIDVVLARMRLRFLDTVVRLETYPQSSADGNLSSRPTASDLGVALEIRIDELEFIDEQLEACQKTGASNADSKQPITTQPHSLYTVPDLNKLLHLKGVRLYTDLFSRPELAPDAASLLDRLAESTGGSCSTFTSMYLRRQHVKKSGNLESSQTSPGSDGVSPVFYSCCNNENSPTGGNSTGATPTPAPLAEDLGISCFQESTTSSCSSDRAKPPNLKEHGNLESWIGSDPVQFGFFAGDRQTVRFRLRNTEISPGGSEGLNKKLDVEMFLGGLSVILTPTQVYLLIEILQTLLEPGNWSGEEKFYSTSRRLNVNSSRTTKNRMSDKKTTAEEVSCDDGFTSIIMTDSPSSLSCQDTQLKSTVGPDLLQPLNVRTTTTSGAPMTSGRSSKSPKSPGSADRPEVTHCNMRLASLLVVLTHTDPLASETKTKCGIEKLHGLSQRFFEQTMAIALSVRSDLENIRKDLDEAYPADHLRFVGCPAVLDCTLERGLSTENLIVQFSTANCEFLECLSADSVILDQNSTPRRNSDNKPAAGSDSAGSETDTDSLSGPRGIIH